MIQFWNIDMENVDLHKRIIVTREELAFLRANNPWWVQINPLPGERAYEIIVQEVASSFHRWPVSWKLFYFVFKGKTIGELDEQREQIAKEDVITTQKIVVETQSTNEEKVTKGKKVMKIKKVWWKVLGKVAKKSKK